MVALAAVNLGRGHDDIGRRLTAGRRYREKIQTRIERGIGDGDLPPGLDPAAAASYLQSVLHGLSIQARDGRARDQARRSVDAALIGWDAMVVRSDT